MLSQIFPRPSAPETGVFIGKQVQLLRQRNVDFTVISPVPWAPAVGLTARLRATVSASLASPREWAFCGCKVLAPRHLKLPRILDFGSYGYLYYRGIRSTARELHRRRRFDLIHSQWMVPDGFAGALLSRDLDIPVVATERGYLPSYVHGRVWERAEARWALENVDQTVFVAKALAELATTMARPKLEPLVVYTGVDRQRFFPAASAQARRALGIPERAKVLLLVGHDALKKGVLEVLEAIHLLGDRYKNLLFFIIGSGGATEVVQQRIKRLQLSSVVRAVGVCPQGEIAQWYQASDIVTLPSWREGVPNSLVEAAACGRPVVASNIMGIPEIVEDGKSGLLVQPGDPAGLSQALEALLSDETRCREMGEAAALRVRHRFDWNVHARKMQEVYESICRHR